MPKKSRAKIRPPKSLHGWVSRWQSDIKVIRRKVDTLWLDREAYKEYRTIITGNSHVARGSTFFDLVDRMYVTHMLAAIRTLVDPPAERISRASISLASLLKEINDNASLLTREWFVNRSLDRSVGKDQYKTHWSGRRHISQRRITADLRLLERLCSRIRVTVNKYLAHNSRRKPPVRLTNREIDATIDGLFRLVSRYNALLLNTASTEPASLSSRDVFEVPWVPPRTRRSGQNP